MVEVGGTIPGNNIALVNYLGHTSVLSFLYQIFDIQIPKGSIMALARN